MSVLAVEAVRTNLAARQNDLRLYLEIVNDSSKASFWIAHFSLIYIRCSGS